jgi:hypothetical protein
LSKKDVIAEKNKEDEEKKKVPKKKVTNLGKGGESTKNSDKSPSGGGFFASLISKAVAQNQEIAQGKVSSSKEDLDAPDSKGDDEKEIVVTNLEEWLSDGAPSNGEINFVKLIDELPLISKNDTIKDIIRYQENLDTVLTFIFDPTAVSMSPCVKSLLFLIITIVGDET